MAEDPDIEWASVELTELGVAAMKPLLVRIGRAEHQRNQALAENRKLAGQLTRILAVLREYDTTTNPDVALLVLRINEAAQLPDQET